MLRRNNVGLVTVCLVALAVHTAHAGTIYVDVDATGSDDGTSWANAYTDISTALSNCTAVDELWVADGTYRESWFGFGMTDGCGIYGGFDGTETARSEADPATNETIISGDISNNDPTITDNANSVVWFTSSITSNTVLDGFTITAGYADGGGSGNSGGGLLLYGNPMLSRLIFRDNHAVSGGGAVQAINTEAVLDRCTFHDNDAWLGGVMYLSGSDLTIANSLFYDNLASNGSTGYGGALFLANSDPELINVSFADNTADTDGGGIYNDAIVGGSHPVIVNSILWGNVDAGGTNDETANMHGAGSSTPVVTYTDWGGHTGGTGNIDDDPGFSGDYVPSPSSDVINAGSDTDAYGTEDLVDNERIVDSAVDMGAIERPTEVIYVDVDAAGNNDGTTWANAYTDISTALSNCNTLGELWVADGTYRESWFGLNMTDGCGIYGGFDGTETLRNQADPLTNETIISGDISNNDPTITDNADHVVYFGSITSDTVMDGFTITAGYADGGGSNNSGGGMFLTGSPMLSRLVFRNNHAEADGGAIIAVTTNSVINRCRFHDNDAWLGGAMYITGSDLTIANSLFNDNLASDGSGTGFGGALFLVVSDPDLINDSFGDNTADTDGGGIYNDALSGGSHPAIVNSILWNNVDAGGTNNESANMHSAGSSTPVVTYTDWGGHTGGTGNLNSNPLWGTNYHPAGLSIVVNNGDNASVHGSYDLDGENRIRQNTVDMGAFEGAKAKPSQF